MSVSVHFKVFFIFQMVHHWGGASHQKKRNSRIHLHICAYSSRIHFHWCNSSRIHFDWYFQSSRAFHYVYLCKCFSLYISDGPWYAWFIAVVIVLVVFVILYMISMQYAETVLATKFRRVEDDMEMGTASKKATSSKKPGL